LVKPESQSLSRRDLADSKKGIGHK
jgi:hypothetical protein